MARSRRRDHGRAWGIEAFGALLPFTIRMTRRQAIHDYADYESAVATVAPELVAVDRQWRVVRLRLIED